MTQPNWKAKDETGNELDFVKLGAGRWYLTVEGYYVEESCSIEIDTDKMMELYAFIKKELGLAGD